MLTSIARIDQSILIYVLCYFIWLALSHEGTHQKVVYFPFGNLAIEFKWRLDRRTSGHFNRFGLPLDNSEHRLVSLESRNRE